MSGGRCAVQERATKAFGRRQKLDWDVFRSPIGVTFIRARKNVGKKTNLGTRVLGLTRLTLVHLNLIKIGLIGLGRVQVADRRNVY